jgi:hypothetical protein
LEPQSQVETYVESKPGVGSADQDFQVLPLAEVCPEVSAGCLRGFDTLDRGIFVRDRLAGCQYVVNICGGLGDIALDIHGEPRSLWDGETEVECNNTRDASKTNHETPGMIDRDIAGERRVEDRVLICFDNNDTDEGSSYWGLINDIILGVNINQPN